MRIVRHGTAPLLDQDLAEIQTYEVSTPQTRRAAVNDLRRQEEVAAGRRRRVLLVLLAALSVVIGLGAVELVPWWTVAVPGGLLVVFFVVARVSVRFMLKSLDARYRDICQGSDEATVFLSRKEVRPVDGAVASVGSKVEPAAKSRALGAGPHHHADLRLQAAGAAYGPDDRPLRPERHAHGPAADPRHRRCAASGRPGPRRGRRRRFARGRFRVTDGKVCVLIGPEPVRGAMAQSVARLVRNEKVRGSNPLSSTQKSRGWWPARAPHVHPDPG